MPLRYSIAVGSKNPVKIHAAVEGIRRALVSVHPNAVFESEGFDVPSGVPDQPFGDTETKKGALNRCMAAFEAYKLAHGGTAPSFSVGLEGGCEWIAAEATATTTTQAAAATARGDGEGGGGGGGGVGGAVCTHRQETLDCFAWMVVFDGKQSGFSRTCTFTLPKAISDLVKQVCHKSV